MPPAAPPPTPADTALLNQAFNSCKGGLIGNLRGSEANAYKVLKPLLSEAFLGGVLENGMHQRIKRWWTQRLAEATAAGTLPPATDAAVQQQLQQRADFARPAFEGRMLVARVAQAVAPVPAVAASQPAGAALPPAAARPAATAARPAATPKAAARPAAAPKAARVTPQQHAAAQQAPAQPADEEEQAQGEYRGTWTLSADASLPPGAVAYTYSYDRHTIDDFPKSRPRFFQLVLLNDRHLLTIGKHHKTVFEFKSAAPAFVAAVKKRYKTNDAVAAYVIGKFQAPVDMLQGAKKRMTIMAFYPDSDTVDRHATGYLYNFDRMTVITPQLSFENINFLETALIAAFKASGEDMEHRDNKCKNLLDGGNKPGTSREAGCVYVVSKFQDGQRYHASTLSGVHHAPADAAGSAAGGQASAKRPREDGGAGAAAKKPKPTPKPKAAVAAAPAPSAPPGPPKLPAAPAPPKKAAPPKPVAPPPVPPLAALPVPAARPFGRPAKTPPPKGPDEFIIDGYIYSKADLKQAHALAVAKQAGAGALSWRAVGRQLGTEVANASRTLPEKWAVFFPGVDSRIAAAVPKAPKAAKAAAAT
jgi:hypothetical protein